MSSASSEGCVLHVAALPFPSYQGTQAAIRAMLEASTRAGRASALFTYASSGYPLAPGFVLHRTGDFPRVTSLRSGPSLRKVLLDARMLWELHALIRRVKPRAIVAHHVEAAAIALAFRSPPTVFFAHTDLATELPTYADARFSAGLAWAGRTLDRALLRRSDAIATISPALREHWLAQTRRDAFYVPTPWAVPEPIPSRERTESRRAFGLDADSCVALYAGNLDAYQDPCSVLDALHRLQRQGVRVTLLLATHSDTRNFIRHANRLGVAFRTSSLAGEQLRRQIHAAADLAIVPRGPVGGLPIKLLDALARGVPCAISPHAAAGCKLDEITACASQQGAKSLALAVAGLAQDRSLRARLAERGRAYIEREHSDARFLSALDAALASATTAQRAKTQGGAHGKASELRS
jgi:glycosyltransferase involved in cell wall biosynthesis